jgi:signal transduction histidine kinase
MTGHSRLLGYVAVGVSQAHEIAQLRRAVYVVIGLGCCLVLGSLPLAYVLVHRIFQPIRQLHAVTRRISAGDLDARAAIHRPDVIGDLARSFDEMVQWVKQQRQELADANRSLEEINRDLEQKIEQRTAALETANQRLAAEIAEKEEFLRAVSHDLNAPLRNIGGIATVLLMKYREKFDEEIVHRLERIKSNVDVETDLIAELLELSRIKTRRQKMEPVDVAEIVSELKGVFENDLRSRAIHLIVDTALPVLDAERARIRQVFQNLIDNAIKYIGDGAKKQIRLGCQVRPREAEFYVADTGVGIEQDDLEKVFFVFRRGKNVATQNIAGKGVGLASVKSIIETYNGKIWATSELGVGTTFRFTINGKYVQNATAASAQTTTGTHPSSPSSPSPPSPSAAQAA